jgi:hypothetical protein
MNVTKIIAALRNFCQQSTGDEHTWNGNKSTYKWNLGRSSSNGVANGVVRKLIGKDNTGAEIWVVAGSFKIDVDGSILRFTGLPTKMQQQIIDATESEPVILSNVAVEEYNV